MKPFLLLSLLLSSLPSLSGGAETTPPAVTLPASVQEIAPAQVERQLVEHPDTLILDVRTEEERRTRGFLLNSIHHDYFHGQQAQALDKTKPCLLYCAMGGRAKRMAVEMHKIGFQHILLLQGGFDAWTAQGLAVAK